MADFRARPLPPAQGRQPWHGGAGLGSLGVGLDPADGMGELGQLSRSPHLMLPWPPTLPPPMASGWLSRTHPFAQPEWEQPAVREKRSVCTSFLVVLPTHPACEFTCAHKRDFHHGTQTPPINTSLHMPACTPGLHMPTVSRPPHSHPRMPVNTYEHVGPVWGHTTHTYTGSPSYLPERLFLLYPLLTQTYKCEGCIRARTRCPHSHVHTNTCHRLRMGRTLSTGSFAASSHIYTHIGQLTYP